jgi:hypothetical protein
MSFIALGQTSFNKYIRLYKKNCLLKSSGEGAVLLVSWVEIMWIPALGAALVYEQAFS